MARRAEDIPQHLGRFMAGMTGPAVPVIFAKYSGGWVNCSGAAVSALAQRWHATKLAPFGPLLLTADLTPVDPVRGRFLFDWLTSDVGSVPTTPGIYVLTCDLIFPSGQEFPSQQATFEVIARPAGL